MKKLLNFQEEKMSNNLSIAAISALIVIFLVVLIVIGIIKRPVIRRKNSSTTLREAEFTADDRYFLELMKTAAEIIKNTK